MRNKILSLLLFVCFGSIIGMAQDGTVRGHIYDKTNGEPIIYANVILENTTIGATTDLDGLFVMSNVPIGDYTISCSYIGYETSTAFIKVKNKQITTQQLYLAEGGISLGVIDISAEKQQARTEVGISKLKISRKEIKALPSTGGDADILQYLQVLPGVISTGDQGGQLYIRGGSPVQNKILLDGLTIYNPFHSIGFYSVFETELIRNVDVLTGGYNAEYGGRISAVVDITTREGNRSRLAGQISASPFMVKGLVEVPIIKFEEGKSTSGSFVFSAKKSVIDQTSKTLYNYAAVNDSVGLPFEFTDVYGKMSFVTSNGSKFNIFGFNYDDVFNNPNIAKIGWNNAGGGMNFTLVPNNSGIIIDGIIGFTNYETNIDETDGNPRESAIKEYLLGLDFNLFGNNYDFKYGIEVKGIRTDFNFVNPFGLGIEQRQNTTEISGFLKYRRAWEGLVIEPSVRIQYYASLSEFSIEPRLGVKYNITDKWRFKGAAGYYSQNLIASSNERDVVTLFTGFLSGPDQKFNDLNGDPITTKLQLSRHAIAGFEYDITNNLQFNVEGYLKDFPQLVIINRNKIEATDSNYSTEEGKAYGIDFSLKYEKGPIYVWATYSNGYVDRYDGDQEYPTVFDRRHNLNFLTTYTFGIQKDWQLSLRYNMGSGFPFTKTQGFYNYLPFIEGVGSDYLTDNPDEIGIIYSEDRNSGRLPYYHRVDFSAQKTFFLSDHSNVEIVASVTNALDRKNIFYFDRIEYDRVNQLPIIPSAAVRYNF